MSKALEHGDASSRVAGVSASIATVKIVRSGVGVEVTEERTDMVVDGRELTVIISQALSKDQVGWGAEEEEEEKEEAERLLLGVCNDPARKKLREDEVKARLVFGRR